MQAARRKELDQNVRREQDSAELLLAFLVARSPPEDKKTKEGEKMVPVKLRVSGLRPKTQKETASQHPQSVFGNISRKCSKPDKHNQFLYILVSLSVPLGLPFFLPGRQQLMTRPGLMAVALDCDLP